MKPKNFAILALCAVLIGVGLWWFMQSVATPTPQKTAAVPAPAPAPIKTEAPKPAPHDAPIAAPIAPPVQDKPAPPVAAKPKDADPQADLKTAIHDIARLTREGDSITLWQTYTLPEKQDPNFLLQVQQSADFERNNTDPQLKQIMERIRVGAIRAFEELETQTPTMNEAGNEATYNFTLPSAGEGPGTVVPRTFIKVNGKWYFKD